MEQRIKDLNGKRGVYWIRHWWWSIYVGKSNNIGRRLRSHMRSNSDAGKYMKRHNVSVHHLTRFTGLEELFIKLLRPSLNKQHNPRRRNRRGLR